MRGLFCIVAVITMAAAAFADENLVRNPGFEDTADTSWNLNNWAKNDVTGEYDKDNPRGGSYSYRMTMVKVKGTSELHFQQKLELKTARKLRLRFAMRGTGEKKASVLIRKINAPWTVYASRQVKVSKEWKDYSFMVTLPDIDPDDSGIFIVLGEAASLWIDDVSVTPATDADGSTADTVTSLDGQWQVQSPGGWSQTVAVPGFLENVSGTKSLHQFTYTRTFDVPEAGDERRTILKFDAVGDAADIYVNGQFAGGHIGAALPFEVDVSGCVESPSSSNRLEVMVRDDSFFSTPRESKDWRNRKHFIPRGMGAYNRKGIYQSVSLISRPVVHVADTYIRTSVRDKKITVTYELYNGKKESIRVRLEGTVVAAGGEAVFSIPPADMELGGFVRTKISVSAPFTGVTLWQPDHPSLYTLRTKLATKAGVVLHENSTRFGFREVWFEGINFILNGIRCNLRGESPSYGEKREMFFTKESTVEMLKKFQAVNCNVLRFHSLPAPPHVLDLCDEMGILVIDESAIYASWGMLDPAHPDFMENCREHITRWVRRDRNHPSVITWSAENEGLNVNLLSPAQLAEFKRIIDASDGTRPVIFDGDGTAFGATESSVKHYIRTVDDLKDLGGKASGYAKDLRNDIYWATNFRQSVPLGVGEYLFPYEPGLKEKEREAIYMMGLQARGYRFADWYDIRPYNPSYCGFLKAEGVKPGLEEAYDVIVKSFAPVAVYDMAYDELGPFPKAPQIKSGQPQQRTLVIYNDTFSGTVVEVGWRVMSGDKKIAGEKKTMTVGLGDHVTSVISFTPNEAGDITLELMAAKDGREMFRDGRRFNVVP
ncbi:MAG: carbohydrate binding domain-containing protein [Spirochaetes bacterium]|nr:carbohydrate binding domain-containing protein [Spirochaetota bacterium]